MAMRALYARRGAGLKAVLLHFFAAQTAARFRVTPAKLSRRGRYFIPAVALAQVARMRMWTW
jgi:hypothetical protein